LIEVDYEPLPAMVSDRRRVAPGAPLVWDDCPDNICFVHLEGDKAKDRLSFAAAAHVCAPFRHQSRHRGDQWSRAAASATTTAPTAATHLLHAAAGPPVFAPDSLTCAEGAGGRVRVVAGDIGRQLGMKSAVYNEVALVLLAAKNHRPSREMGQHTIRAFPAMPRPDNVTDAELALAADGTFLGLRVKTIAGVGAYLQVGAGSGRQSRLARRRLPHAGDPMPTSPPSSATPIRSGPTAATAVPRRLS